MITMLKQGKDYITDKHGIYTEYVCSSAADVANLPTGANSEAEEQTTPRQYGCCTKYGRRRRIRVCAFK